MRHKDTTIFGKPADLWFAFDNPDHWQLFRADKQIIKAAKHDVRYAEYWPSAEETQFIVDALNAAEAQRADAEPDRKPTLWCVNCAANGRMSARHEYVEDGHYVCLTCRHPLATHQGAGARVPETVRREVAEAYRELRAANEAEADAERTRELAAQGDPDTIFGKPADRTLADEGWDYAAKLTAEAQVHALREALQQDANLIHYGRYTKQRKRHSARFEECDHPRCAERRRLLGLTDSAEPAGRAPGTQAGERPDRQ